jgi:ankyrin repeat protein
LHFAVLSGYGSSIPLLIEKGAEVNARDRLGRTPLSYAAEKQNVEVVKSLLSAHADPNLGVSPPLHIAARTSGAPEIPELLLKAGADADKNANVLEPGKTVNPYNVTPLLLAVVNTHPALVHLLLEAKADPNQKASGNPLLYHALREPEILKALLDAGADPNAEVSSGWRILHEAVAGNNIEPVQMLLASGAKINATGRRGETPLHIAAQRSTKEILNLLLKNNPDLNAQDNEGRTPLWYAVGARREEALGLLLEAGADPNLRDKSEQTPLDLAQNEGTQGDQGLRNQGFRMSAMLKEHGARADLPRMDRISVRRPSASYKREVFFKGTNDWNRFSLLELLATYYGLLSPQTQTRGLWQSESKIAASIWASELPFPDLNNLTIHRPSSDGKSWTNIAVNATEILASGDCARDVWLQWGDVVEAPEADHPIADQWEGLSEEFTANLVKCLSREITVKVKGTNSVLRLAPEYNIPEKIQNPPPGFRQRVHVLRASFVVRSVLDQEKLIRFSSDLRRVKVTRPNSNQWTIDCSSDNPPNLWLRDGDIVEVPEK